MFVLINFAFSGINCTTFLRVTEMQSRSWSQLHSSPHHTLFIHHFPHPGSTEQLSRLLSAMYEPSICPPKNSYQLEPGKSCPLVPLVLLTSGSQIIPICWSSPPCRVSEKPEPCSQHLKHLKCYLSPVPWRGRAQKYLRYGGRKHSFKCCVVLTSTAADPEGYGKESL